MSVLSKTWWVFILVLLTEDCSLIKETNQELWIEEGIKYRFFSSNNKAKVHVVKIDTQKFSPEIIRPKSKKLEPLSQFIKPMQHLIAINGSFFEKEGRSSGALKINGKWLRYPNLYRGVFGWKKKDKNLIFFFDRLGFKQKKTFSKFHKKPWFREADNIITGAPFTYLQRKET